MRQLEKLLLLKKRSFNILLRGACLRFLLTRAQDSKKHFEDKMLKIKNPVDYYERLLFHRNMSGNYDFF